MSSEPSIKKRPATARSTVAEYNTCGILNSNSAADPEHSDLMIDQLCLSPEKLKIISGSDDLNEVTSLELCVDTRQDTIDNFGIHLPKLTHLKINNSVISSVRDLGTSLSHLQVLWMARCGLTDLEGIPALSLLKELYVAYNSISDLSPVSLLENLELLDLEGNNVNDLTQLWYLSHCGKLRTLSLEGNPVCTCPGPEASEVSDYSYRTAVRELIPQLHFIDDIPIEEDKPQCCRVSPLDWTLLKESFKDISVNDGLEHTDTEEICVNVCCVRPASAWPFDMRISSKSHSSHPDNARPLTSCTRSRPGSAGSDLSILKNEASDLTNGVGSVFCGNPVEAVRARRQKIKLQNSHSQTRPSTSLGSYIPEHTYDHEQSSNQDRSDVFAELRSWRIEQNKHLLAIESLQPQVIKIHHSDDEGSHNYSFSDITRDRTVCRDTSSFDSSFQPPSPESSDMLRLTSSTGSMSPSPPTNAALSPACRRITQFRNRRLRPHNPGTNKLRPSEETPVTDLRDMCPEIVHKPHIPAISPLREQCLEATRNHQDKPIMHSDPSEKRTRRRPQTARAALQRLPDLNLLPA